jgi:hypothetical protein
VILQDGFFSINGVDLSCEVRELTVEDSRADHDNTTICHKAESVEPGLGRWTISAKLRQSYAPGGVNATLRPLVGTMVTVVVRPRKAPAAPDNEQITGNGIFLKYNPISGQAGQPIEPDVEIRNSGTLLDYTTA